MDTGPGGFEDPAMKAKIPGHERSNRRLGLLDGDRISGQ
jgi:hypothetical protein